MPARLLPSVISRDNSGMYIGEVSAKSGVSARMLRHYESLGLLQPAGRSSAGYREYRDPDLRRIFYIESLRSLGMSLTEVKSALEDPQFHPEQLVGELLSASRERLRRERELLTRLRAVQEVEPQAWEEVLDVVGLLRNLRSPELVLRNQAALEAGSRADSPVATLAELTLKEDNVNIAGALEWALKQTGDEGLEIIARAMRHSETRIRRRAVRILATVGEGASSSIRAALRAGLGDPDAQVRQEAALILGAEQVLIEMIAAGEHDVEAAEALALLPDPQEIIATLRHRLELEGHAARARITQTLAEFPIAAVRETLETLTTDPDPQVALTAKAILVIRRARPVV